MSADAHHTLEVGKRAFARFAHALETGEWQPFVDMLADDFTFWFPVGKFHGLNEGKDRAIEFFDYVTETFSPGLTLTLDRVTSSETTVVFEFRDEGFMWGDPYKNRIAVSFDIEGDKIIAYREYMGSDGKSN
ncbi:MAG: nuclear transport factor 2 family protein [Leptolyngbyaceae cyanobacterium MO_188.B28]|nr:nuclear transport factor 2 family protein [Leptolyngbyaceae cyanobacterium MO_188.B28]